MTIGPFRWRGASDTQNAMVIFGWLRPFTILGLKVDECANCGQVCNHYVGRRVTWGHVFWVPVLFLGFSHGMMCSICGAWTSLSRATVRNAVKTGSFPSTARDLTHPRPSRLPRRNPVSRSVRHRGSSTRSWSTRNPVSGTST